MRTALALCLAVGFLLPCQAATSELARAKAQAAAAPRPPLHPREAYFRRPAILDARLSPDGRHLSWVQRGDKGLDLHWQDVARGKRTRLVAGLDRAETAWSGDGQRLWLADEAGLAVIEAGSIPRPRRVFAWKANRTQRLWRVDPRAPGFAIVHEKEGQAAAERHRYLRVDPQGKTLALLQSTRPLKDALLDADGRLAFVAAYEGPGYDVAIRRLTPAGPKELLRCRAIEECRLVGYDAGEGTLWLLSQQARPSRPGDDRLALRRWHRDRWETVHRDPDAVADADAVLWSPARQDWLAIAYHGARRRWHGHDAGTKALLSAIERKLPGDNLRLDPSADGKLWLVRAQRAERALDRHFLYRAAQDRLEPLFAHDDAAPPGVPMHALSYRADDGRTLHGYVLLPAGVAPGQAPLVAWLHGGPIARLHDRYDPCLQLLANRGYAVFVPNFRASSGYGLAHTLSAKGDVGKGPVLQDILDGLDFVLAQGIGDRSKQAVMGMSFGGYASLLAVTHHPARFQLAFAAAPPTDYGWIKQWQADHDSAALRASDVPLSLQFPQLGFRYRDPAWRQEMLRESPLANLTAVRAPIHLWAGAHDDHVPLKSIAHYAGELRRSGKPLALLIDPDAGHAPDDPRSADAFLYFMESAAHRHLGGRLLPPSKELQAFLARNLRIDAARR